jgi:hypothetical protein
MMKREKAYYDLDFVCGLVFRPCASLPLPSFLPLPLLKSMRFPAVAPCSLPRKTLAFCRFLSLAAAFETAVISP